MENLTYARIIHVLVVVFWIGGVAMVTTVLIPAIKRLKSKEDKIKTFERIEGKFAVQAKITTLLTALSGFYMVEELEVWGRFLELKYWWMHAMVLVWLIFTIILFILEPLVFHKLFREYVEKNPGRAFKIMQRAHWFLLILSLITIVGAMAGSHGLYFF